MTGDKRSAVVIVALIAAMSAGAAMLRSLELRLVPGKPSFKGSTLLMAERELHVREVELSYIGSWAELPTLGLEPDGPESLCIIAPDGSAVWTQRGPRVQVVVVGSDAGALGSAQKRALLGALGTLTEASGRDLVPIQLAAGLDDRYAAGLDPAARELLGLLERKGIIR